jgi:hypothetical protein
VSVSASIIVVCFEIRLLKLDVKDAPPPTHLLRLSLLTMPLYSSTVSIIVLYNKTDSSLLIWPYSLHSRPGSVPSTLHYTHYYYTHHLTAQSARISRQGKIAASSVLEHEMARAAVLKQAEAEARVCTGHTYIAHCTLYSVHHARCTMHYALCTMHALHR